MLIDYWRSRISGAAPPQRSEIDPAGFAPLAAQVFVLGRLAAGAYPFRLAGEAVRDLFGCDLRGRCLTSLLRPGEAGALRMALEASRRTPEPIVLAAFGLTGEARLPLEILLAPLAGGRSGPDRYLGCLQPLAPAPAGEARPVRQLAVEATTSAGRTGLGPPRVRLAALDGRRIA